MEFWIFMLIMDLLLPFMLPITVIFMLLAIGKNEGCVGSMGGIICGVQLIPLIGSILPTEIALKKNFNKNGTRR